MGIYIRWELTMCCFTATSIIAVSREHDYEPISVETRDGGNDDACLKYNEIIIHIIFHIQIFLMKSYRQTQNNDMQCISAFIFLLLFIQDRFLHLCVHCW